MKKLLFTAIAALLFTTSCVKESTVEKLAAASTASEKPLLVACFSRTDIKASPVIQDSMGDITIVHSNSGVEYLEYKYEQTIK